MMKMLLLMMTISRPNRLELRSAYPAMVSKLILVDAEGFPLNATSIPLGFRLPRNPLISPLVKYVLPRFVVA